MPWGHTLHSLQLRCATSLSMRSLSSPRFSKHGKHNHRFASGDASARVLCVADVVGDDLEDVAEPDVEAG